MSSYTSEKLAFVNAENFKKAFSNTTDVLSSVGYLFIGKSYPHASESSPDSIQSTNLTERELWDNMIAAKKITGENLQLVIQKYEYTTNTTYKQYDDTITLTDLLTENVSLDLKPMYVINSENEVYKCLSNGNGALSVTEPSGANETSNGNIIIPADGYVWKYMYKVPEGSNFTTNTWIPAPSLTGKIGYNTSEESSVDGEIVTIQVVNVGSGYVNSSIKLLEFGPSNTVLSVNTSTFSAQNLAIGMGISGPGIIGDVYITTINVAQAKVTISSNTLSSGGGTANTYNVFTRVVVLGDGTGSESSASVRCVPVLNGNTISKINVTEFGKNYTWSNVIIYGTGTNASARAIISPTYGHGYNPAEELGAKNVMVSVTIGEIDSTENGLISDEISYRQYGILKDPHLYGQSTPVNYNSANSFISQTFDILPGAGISYSMNEIVYQGVSANTATFSGRVNSTMNNILKLTNVRGQISNVTLLKSATVPTGRQIGEWYTPKFQPYTGQILYAENRVPISRELNQSENIKLIIKY